MKFLRKLVLMGVYCSATACTQVAGETSATIPAETPVAEKLHITLHANLAADTKAPSWLRRLNLLGNSDLMTEAEVVTRGHAWISVRSSGSCETYSLFGEGTTQNQEVAYSPGILRTKVISPSQLHSLELAVQQRRDYKWLGYYNCATYASELWHAATGEKLDPVPSKLFAVKQGVVAENTTLKPLPPSPLGLVQEIVALAQTEDIAFVSEASSVCP